ncbi:HGxxPAAW family protein [uncultured Aeromicrobium sp.]|uniref:HGxxPAAW family protein n=1 Tax=uncultured Aeromicrobium sp. TaxID=337820 RepID=UPI0025D453ED|nr:HGxxPAAW family protein [uncultured Aeromicrobium sp.]
MSHGSSPAAWTAVIVSLVGFTVGCIALIPSPNWTLFTIGCVLAVGALPLGKILSMAGFGAEREKQH